MILRDYQKESIGNARLALKECQSTLVVMATGLGKTVVMIDMIRSCLSKGGRAMLVAHREELIEQPRGRIVTTLGVMPGVEKAERRADQKDGVVIASIQTLVSGVLGTRRYQKFDPNDYSLLLIDEAHHAASPSYREFVDYMKQNKSLKVVGVTATPDRGDEVGLSCVFDSCAYEYSILDGINNGWLVPIKQMFVRVGTLDYSNIKTVAGDLCGKELAEVLEEEKNLHGMIPPTLEMAGDKPTIIFAATVRQAELIAEIINRHKPESASWVSGKTPKKERKELLKDFSNGKLQFVANVGVLVEGFDQPSVACVAMFTATKSRARYTQCIGRGTRPLTPPQSDSSPTTRRQVIAQSNKPELLVLDFRGNAGRHRLVTTFDVLAGREPPDMIDRAAKSAKLLEPLDPLEELAKAQAREQLSIEREKMAIENKLRKAQIKLKSQYMGRTVDPFKDMGFAPSVVSNPKEKPTDKQIIMLANNGIESEGLTRKQAGSLVYQIMLRRKMGKCSFKQQAVLKEYGLPTDVSASKAKSLIQGLADAGWPKPEPPTG